MLDKEKEFKEVATNLDGLHFDLRLWINKLKHTRAELNILQCNLDKLVKHYFNPESMMEVEQYQNKIIVYSELADRLIKEAKCLRNKVADFGKTEISVIDEDEIPEIQQALIEKITSYFNYVEDVKNNFLHFYTTCYISENHVN
jgi:hypothetical protein